MTSRTVLSACVEMLRRGRAVLERVVLKAFAPLRETQSQIAAGASVNVRHPGQRVEQRRLFASAWAKPLFPALELVSWFMSSPGLVPKELAVLAAHATPNFTTQTITAELASGRAVSPPSMESGGAKRAGRCQPPPHLLNHVHVQSSICVCSLTAHHVLPIHLRSVAN